MSLEVKYIENVSEPWISMIQTGIKTVEGRLKRKNFSLMRVGDMVEWINSEYEMKRVKTIIKEIREYRTFREYLESEGLERCLPEIKDIESGIMVYYKYYTEEDERKYGIVALRLERIFI